MNREQWLTGCLLAFRGLFARFGFHLPARIRVACGPTRSPNRRARRTAVAARRPSEETVPDPPTTPARYRLSESYPSRRSADGTSEVFIAPELADAARVANVLLEELIYVYLDQSGRVRRRDARFARVAAALGFVGQPDQLTPGESLARSLNSACVKLGTYPHAKLERVMPNATPREASLHRLDCPKCAWSTYITRKQMTVGLGFCPKVHPMQVSPAEHPLRLGKL